MRLHFDAAHVRRLLEASKKCENPRSLYGKEVGKGLFLVGDEGVYLMSNCQFFEHPKKPGKEESADVCYAEEVNPDKLDFDTWWANKRASFGGDDGGEFFSVEDIEACLTDDEHLVMDVTPAQIALMKVEKV
jgi:hypothetical protein